MVNLSDLTRAGGQFTLTLNSAGSGIAGAPTHLLVRSASATFNVAVYFPDLKLEGAVRDALGKPTGDILPEDMLRLTVLNGQARGITDLTGLQYAGNLQELNLTRNYALSNLSPLAGLGSLRKLQAYNDSISDVKPLGGLRSLTDLDLGGNRISDVSALGGLTALKNLYLCQNQIGSISALRNLGGLGLLNLSSNQVSDISALAGLSSLAWLNLSSNQVSDLGPVGGLTGLGALYVSGNRVRNISALGNLTKLTTLDLSNNQIVDAGVLGALKGLNWLDLSINQVQDISGLANLTQLTQLGLSANQISDIGSLRGLTKLFTVGLSQNYVDVSAGSAAMAVINALQSGVTHVSYLPQYTPVTAQITSATGDSASITFSEAVSGFDVSDLSLKRYGVAVALGAAQAPVSGDGIHWMVNLSDLTRAGGQFTLTLNSAGSGIAGAPTHLLVRSASASFTVNNVTIAGAAGDYYVQGAGPNLVLYEGSAPVGTPIYTALLADVTSLTLNAGAANARLIIGSPLPFLPRVAGTGTETLDVRAGSYGIETDLGNVRLVLENNASIVFSASQHLASLTLSDQAKAKLAANGSRVLRTSGVAIGADAKLDLVDNGLIIQTDSDEAKRADVLRSVDSWIAKARDVNGAWTGAGLTSSAAAANSTKGLAAIINEDAQKRAVCASLFDEQVNVNTVLVRFTRNGDSNLNGLIDPDDYRAIDNGFLLSGSNRVYSDGDLDYNDVVNADDYYLIDTAFLIQQRA